MASGDRVRLSDGSIESVLFSDNDSECSDFSDECVVQVNENDIYSSDSDSNLSGDEIDADEVVDNAQQVRPNDSWQTYTENDPPLRKFNFTANPGFRIPSLLVS